MKSPRDQIKGKTRGRTIGECRIPRTLESVPRCSTIGQVVSGEDYHKRSNRFPRETEKERMAEDTFRNMVGDAGKFGSESNKMVKCMAVF
jgi:hypothetical protein